MGKNAPRTVGNVGNVMIQSNLQKYMNINSVFYDRKERKRINNKQTRLCSIDSSSSKTGWAIFDNGKYTTSGVIDLHSEKDSEKRVENMCIQIIELLEKYKPDIIVIEKLNVGRNMVATRILSKIIGVVYAYSIMNGEVFYYEIQPSQWRKQLGMQKAGRKRDEYKQLSIQYVKDHLGKEVNDDEADSICAGIGYIKMFS